MITVDTECSSCNGSGIYSGFAEQKSVAVVCYTCNGTGCAKITYKPFEKRKTKRGIVKVFEKNCGYGLGVESLGGLSYYEWLNGASFKGKETRDVVCPHLHDQRINLTGCKDVRVGQRISECPHFKTKSKCWAEYDLKG